MFNKIRYWKFEFLLDRIDEIIYNIYKNKNNFFNILRGI